MNPNPYHPIHRTVLVSSSSPSSQINLLSSDHPLFYVKQKNYFLQQLSAKVSVNQKFNPLDLKRNARIDHLISKHQKINKDIQKQKKLKEMYLNADSFKPILTISDDEKKRRKQQKQAQQLRQQLYSSYVQQCNIYQQPQQDTSSHDYQYKQFSLIKQQQHLNNFTILSDYRSDPLRKKQLYLLDLQISKLKQQQQLQKQVKSKLSSCTNNQLLSKISNTIISSYMVYFDEIFNVLIDQILQEEVVYLNGLEAQYYVEKDQEKYNKINKNNKNNSKDQAAQLKAVKMLELVKALDQLAYD